MGLWDKIRGQTDAVDLDLRLKTLRQQLLLTGREHSFARKLVKEREASSIATQCAIVGKGNDPAAFVDVASMLLTYPPEFGFVVASQFLNWAPTIGVQAYPTILNAIGHIDSLWTPMWVGGETMLDNAELNLILTSREERIARAGRLLAVAMVISNTQVNELRRLYQDLSFDETVRTSVVNELRRFDPAIAAHVVA